MQPKTINLPRTNYHDRGVVRPSRRRTASKLAQALRGRADCLLISTRTPVGGSLSWGAPGSLAAYVPRSPALRGILGQEVHYDGGEARGSEAGGGGRAERAEIFGTPPGGVGSASSGCAIRYCTSENFGSSVLHHGVAGGSAPRTPRSLRELSSPHVPGSLTYFFRVSYIMGSRGPPPGPPGRCASCPRPRASPRGVSSPRKRAASRGAPRAAGRAGGASPRRKTRVSRARRDRRSCARICLCRKK